MLIMPMGDIKQKLLDFRRPLRPATCINMLYKLSLTHKRPGILSFSSALDPLVLLVFCT